MLATVSDYTTRYGTPTDSAQITALLADGLNLAGVEAVLALEGRNDELRDEVGRLQGLVDDQGQADPRGTL